MIISQELMIVLTIAPFAFFTGMYFMKLITRVLMAIVEGLLYVILIPIATVSERIAEKIEDMRTDRIVEENTPIFTEPELRYI